MEHKTETAVFGGGCFWCTEAIFNELRGIISAAPGYAGGTVKNPTYEQVSTGETGHAEVTRVEFDPHKYPSRPSHGFFRYARSDEFEPAGK